MKVPVVEPAGIVIEAGTEAYCDRELRRLTVQPPVGAADVRVTVPVEVCPPVTVEGDKVNEAIESPRVVKTVLRVVAPSEAVILKVWVRL